MAATCPNRRRRARIAHGGGALQCRGHLEVVLRVPVVLPLKSMRDPSSPERALPVRVLRHGLRVKAPELRAAFETPDLRDIVCSACGWSLKRATAALKARRRSR